MITFDYLLVIILAAWRISSLLIREDGPFFIFKRLREFTGIQHDQDGNVSIIPEKFFPELFSCLWCTSIWVAIGLTIFWILDPKIVFVIALPFSISAGVVIAEKIITGIESQ